MFKNMKMKTRIITGFTLLIGLMIIMALYGLNRFVADQDYMGINIFIAIVVCAVVAGLYLEVALVRAVSRPVNSILDACEKMTRGETDIEIQHFDNNEFADITVALEQMNENSKHHAELAHEIALGDLTVTVKPHSEHDLLGNALYELVEDNNEVMSGIKESTMQVTAGAEQVADASQALAQGSTEQASAIEQITASMDEIADKTKTNASQANSAADIVHEVKTGAGKGNTQMHDMMTAMHEINASSESISKVIKVIDDIAFQTNILALNATVEAARAGVHGKGFAVVAEEVRNLAEKSAAAANETNEMIQDSIQRVHKGTALAEDTAKALDTIVESIEKVVVLIDGIANASSEQATAVTQINQAISQVSQVVQTNSATSEQCASASEELANQAEALRDLIGKFRLRENGYHNKAYTPAKETGKSKVKPEYTAKEDNERIISLDGGYGKY